MSVDELATLDGSKCILVIRGERPNLSNKYDITQHPQYKRLSDYDQKNLYDVKKELASFRRKRRKSAVDKK
jgi:type IV secretion system protein VirD4